MGQQPVADVPGRPPPTRREGSRDGLLLGLLLPVWLLCTGLQLPSLLRPHYMPRVGVSADERGGHPTVVDVSPQIDVALEPGDRLIRLGPVDLRGAGPLQFYAHYLAESLRRHPPRVTYQRGEARSEAELPGVASDAWATGLLRVVSLTMFGVSIALSLRAGSSTMARSLSRASLLWAILFAVPVTFRADLNLAGLGLVLVFGSLAFPALLSAVLRFPSGRPPTSRWARIGPWLFVVQGPLNVNVLAGFPLRYPVGIALFLLVNFAYLVAILVRISFAYRREDILGRRQIRWVVFGFYGALAPALTLMGLELLDRLLFGGWVRFYPWVFPSLIFAVMIPLSFLIAIVRYNLFDVDRLLSAAASYNAVVAMIVAAGLVLVPWFGERSAAWLGLDPRVGQAALSLALAAVVVPAQQRLRPRIEGVFFKERHALDHGIGELLHSLASCDNPHALTERVGSEVARLLRPETCVVYARGSDAFAPIFVEGRGVPPAFEADSPLVAALAKRSKPLAFSPAGRKPDAAELGPFDRAALEALEAEVVAPMRIGESLLAFLCLGPKRSGDVYTSTDLSHLGALAEAVSARLMLFDQAQLLRQSEEMQESLRRYVPGAVADQLASGAEPPSAERDVSVLFVDVRGYTSFAESRRSEEIFSTVNRFTEAVSRIVRAHGGAVVEFNGDGMMAVFGAPRDLPQKEEAAVAAGREIHDAVAALPVPDASGGETRLSVGVGIASGPAFVGNIRAADRMIWSAIGNTTNLAARLQALTRELSASLVIDAATWGQLQAGREDFVRHADFPIRGRRAPQDLFVLPLPAGAPAA
jgi:class 3 adenylate cyclase